MKFILAVLALASFVGPHLALAAVGSGSTLNVVDNTGSISFLAIGNPSFIKIRGEGKGVTGSANILDKNITGSFKFPLSNLSTGIDLRDEHMKEKYLDVKGNPLAELTLSGVSLPKDWSLKNADCKGVGFKGAMNLHGKTAPVSGSLDIAKSDDGKYKMKATFSLKLTDYAIDIPVYAGIHVADSVDVAVEGALK